MSRIDRIKWKNKDIGFKSSGGMFDLFDNQIKSTFRINDNEYDYICENASDSELDLVINDTPTFTEKRELLIMINNYVENYNKSLENGNK